MRCKCNKKLTQAELDYKDPVSDQFLDLCFECLDSVAPEEDPLPEHQLSSDMQDDMEDEDFSNLMEDIKEIS